MKYYWITIAKKEIGSSLREKTLLIVTAIVYILVLVSVVGGYKNYAAGSAQREQASRDFRHEWEEQEANPHSAAHFGTYLFKPFTFLSLYDTGLNGFTGNSYRVEAHKQHEVNYANIRDRDSSMRFGELTLALIFQTLVPLLVIFAGFSAITREKEDNTLRMLIAQGLPLSQLLWGKLAGNYLLIVLIVAPIFFLMALALPFNPSADILLPRLMAFTGTYLVYFFMISGLVIIVSALSKNSRSALLTSLGIWIVLCILLPRVAARIADKAYKLPSRYEFNQNILRGYTQGLSGDSSYVERGKKFQTQLLKRYRVDSLSQLPVNFTGLAMQNGEDYNTKVYLKYSSQVEEKIDRQQTLMALLGFIDPVISVRQLSMGISGTDYPHHVDFHGKARKYRDNLIKALNMKLAAQKPVKGAKYTEGQDFYRSIKDFSYHLPPFEWALAHLKASLLSLFLWTIILLLLINPVSRRIKI